MPASSHLCQSRLQECLRERAELLQVQEAATRQREKEREEYKRAKEAWDRGRKELESNIARLQEKLKQSREETEELERKQKVLPGARQMTNLPICLPFRAHEFFILTLIFPTGNKSL